MVHIKDKRSPAVRHLLYFPITLLLFVVGYLEMVAIGNDWDFLTQNYQSFPGIPLLTLLGILGYPLFTLSFVAAFMYFKGFSWILTGLKRLGISLLCLIPFVPGLLNKAGLLENIHTNTHMMVDSRDEDGYLTGEQKEAGCLVGLIIGIIETVVTSVARVVWAVALLIPYPILLLLIFFFSLFASLMLLNWSITVGVIVGLVLLGAVLFGTVVHPLLTFKKSKAS